jgi:DNA-binding NtrC family response regulator
MPDTSGIVLLEELLKAQPGVLVILMTAHGTIGSAVEAMRKGAFDYLTKPLERDELLIVLGRAMERSRLVRENRMLHEQLRDRFRLENIVGAHGTMQDVFRIVYKVAASNSTVLIYGESGTGKELIARALHHGSDRRGRPFYAVNIAALPESILEAELFGYEKGAFTGAEARKIGLFEQASGSTLFLDEVGDLKRDLQVKLLRALQEREIRRVGENKSRAVDVRVVAATNRDLAHGVAGGAFRQDLYYRLKVVELRVPPLRERRDDILPLARVLLADAALRMRRKMSGLAPAAADQLLRHDWPGNVRELENAMERAVALARGNRVDLEDLPEEIRQAIPRPVAIEGAVRPLEDIEREYILATLELNGGNQTRTAEQLKIGTATLYRKLKSYRARR